MRKNIPFAVLLLVVAVAWIGSAGGPARAATPQPPAPPPGPPQAPQAPQAPQPPMHGHAMAGAQAAVALLQPTAGNQARGTIWFVQQGDKVHVFGVISGLAPDSEHGFHVHQWGDLTSTDGEAQGGHYNPEGHPHGLPHEHPRHAGDLGNVKADAEGHARVDVTVSNLSVAGPLDPIIGRGLILHAKPDTGEQPTGAAGARIAQGVIGIANPQDQALQGTAGGTMK